MKISSKKLATLVLPLLAGSLAGTAHATVYTYQGNFVPEGTPSLATGSASAVYDDVLHTLSVSANFNGLIGTTTASHIHAPTAVPLTGNAGVATQVPSFSGFPLGVQSGTYANTFDLTLSSSWNPSFITANGGTTATAEAAFANFLANGRAYFNIHTSSYGSGEIRAWLVVPEPSSAALAGLGSLGLFLAKRRKRS
jgi:hypothetical protein